jgi:sulfur-oxidizing protein SoxY
MVTLDAPVTADDASLVPITVRVPPEVKQALKSMTLIIDKNPSPVVATFTFGPAAGTGGERSISTRVRIDNFSHVRAILETEDGTLHMASKFVQAAGGCAAMQAKDPDTENEGLGKMLVKTFPPALSTAPLFEGQVMLKHPNSNGMQIDIGTGGYIPARFVKEMTVKRGHDLVFRMESSFSISTNPNFRFTFGRGGDAMSPSLTPTARSLPPSRSRAGRSCKRTSGNHSVPSARQDHLRRSRARFSFLARPQKARVSSREVGLTCRRKRQL